MGQSLLEEQADMQQEIDDLEETNGKLEQRNAELEKLLIQHKIAISVGVSQQASEQETVEDLKEELNQLRTIRSTLATRVEDLEKKHRSSQRELNETRAALELQQTEQHRIELEHDEIVGSLSSRLTAAQLTAQTWDSAAAVAGQVLILIALDRDTRARSASKPKNVNRSMSDYANVRSIKHEDLNESHEWLGAESAADRDMTDVSSLDKEMGAAALRAK
jgi:chromosome segregation ATPase